MFVAAPPQVFPYQSICGGSHASDRRHPVASASFQTSKRLSTRTEASLRVKIIPSCRPQWRLRLYFCKRVKRTNIFFGITAEVHEAPQKAPEEPSGWSKIVNYLKKTQHFMQKYFQVGSGGGRNSKSVASETPWPIMRFTSDAWKAWRQHITPRKMALFIVACCVPFCILLYPKIISWWSSSCPSISKFLLSLLVPGYGHRTVRRSTPMNAITLSLMFDLGLRAAILAMLFVSLANLRGGAFTKSKARLMSDDKTKVKFEDVAGVDEAKEELQEVVHFLKNPSKYKRIGAKLPKGVLLVGPAGTGKTLLARAVAGEAGVPFFSISSSEFVELYVGVGAARVRDLFKRAKQKAPCIVFFDEVDSLGKRRGSDRSDSEREQTLNQLLTQMDGFEASTAIVVLAATNRPDVLDAAFKRPGRFDRQVTVDVPDKHGREAILKVHARDVRLADDVQLSAIAVRTTGFTGAALANLINESALLAVRRGVDEVHMEDLHRAFNRCVAGVQSRTRPLTPHDKRILAYRHTAHAIVAASMPGESTSVHRISVVPRAPAGQPNLFFDDDRRLLVPADEVRGRIATYLAGRVAEQVAFGTVTTGSKDDIKAATQLAERAVTQYGMSAQLGPLAFESVSQALQLGIDAGREIKALMEGANTVARALLEHNRLVLDDLAALVLQNEVIEGALLHAYLARVDSPHLVHYWLRNGHLPPSQSASQPRPPQPASLPTDSLASLVASQSTEDVDAMLRALSSLSEFSGSLNKSATAASIPAASADMAPPPSTPPSPTPFPSPARTQHPDVQAATPTSGSWASHTPTEYKPDSSSDSTEAH